MLACPPVKVPAAVGSPEKVALLIVTPGPTSSAASVAALFDGDTVPIFGTIFCGLRGGGVRDCAAASAHGSSATAIATTRRAAYGMGRPLRLVAFRIVP